MYLQRCISRNLNCLRNSRLSTPISSFDDACLCSCRLLSAFRLIDFKPKRNFSIGQSHVRLSAVNEDLQHQLIGQRGYVKETIVRGQAATNIQQSILNCFVESQDDASSEEWKSVSDRIFELRNGMIHAANIDGKVLEACLVAEKLPLARSYLGFIKSSGKKFNSVTVCGFLRICFECKENLTPEDREKVQLFTKYLLTKYKVLDGISGDSVIKGLILCGMGGKTFQVLEELEKSTVILLTTYGAMAWYFIQNNEPERALEYMGLLLSKSNVSHHKVFLDWIEHYKCDRQKLDDLLIFFKESDWKPSKIICDRLISVYKELPKSFHLEGVYGHVKNSGECSVCSRPFQRIQLSGEQFNEMRASFLNSTVVGNDIFQNSTPTELKRFFSFVEKNAPFDIVLDGLNVAYMTGTYVSPDVFVGLTKKVVQHFAERDNKILLIGRKHMMKWPNYISMLNEFGVKYFFIDDVSEDDPYIIYSTLYSGLDACFVTRDLLRSEKITLSEELHSFFKRWQQSHQIFITYVAPSGKVYMKTPITFQLTVQKTSTNGWHIPYTDTENHGLPVKENYGIHRQWLCLDQYLT